MARIAFAALLFVAALVAGCSSPKPPAPAAQVAPKVAEPAGPCAKYTDPTALARCHLYTSADAWRFVPAAGRSADLDTQLRCAPYRRNSGPYERCISAPQVIAVEPDLEPSAAPPATVARTVPDPAAQSARPPATVGRTGTPAVAHTAPAVGRTYQKMPAALAPPKKVVRSSPYCAENGSCRGDISAYTGRPKTVHVRGYYRKDGTYVRSHYRSRPRR